MCPEEWQDPENPSVYTAWAHPPAAKGGRRKARAWRECQGLLAQDTSVMCRLLEGSGREGLCLVEPSLVLRTFELGY